MSDSAPGRPVTAPTDEPSQPTCLNWSPMGNCEISWFAALCDDDYELLGVADSRLESSWEHCRDIALAAESSGYDNLLLPSGYTLGTDSVAFAAANRAVAATHAAAAGRSHGRDVAPAAGASAGDGRSDPRRPPDGERHLLRPARPSAGVDTPVQRGRTRRSWPRSFETATTKP
jgi:hypothetical protein